MRLLKFGEHLRIWADQFGDSRVFSLNQLVSFKCSGVTSTAMRMETWFGTRPDLMSFDEKGENVGGRLNASRERGLAAFPVASSLPEQRTVRCQHVSDDVVQAHDAKAVSR